MRKKDKKNLFLPSWIVEIIDAEGEKYGGPGVVAAASIFYFNTRKKSEKINILKEFRSKEISLAYYEEVDSIVAAAEADTAKKKRNHPPRSAESG